VLDGDDVLPGFAEDLSNIFLSLLGRR